MKIWSVIIPARNEEKHIGRCLDSLCRLRFDLSCIEVIVADNGSADRTVEIAQAYSDRLDITVLQIPAVAVGRVRNDAAQAARGSFLAFVDADCEVEENWLRDATDLLDSGAGVIGAPYKLPSRAAWPARVWADRFDRAKSGNVSFVPAGNLLIRANAFWKIGGFNEIIRSNEDVEFCCRARALGFEAIADSRLSVVHHGAERNLSHFVRRQFWHGSGVLNPIAFRANLRAIGLAAYALACICLVIVSILLHAPGLLAGSVAALFMPAFALTLAGGRAEGRVGDPVLLIVLIVSYSLARAAVLPVAVLRASREGGRRAIS